MKSKKKHRGAKPRMTSPAAALLDAFTERDLEIWDSQSIDAQLYHDRVYFDLERQRAEHFEELCEALRASPAIQVCVNEAAPGVWRTEPQMAGIPAANQIFGRFIRDAGFEAVLYPSQRGGTSCMAVFPENFRASTSRIEIIGECPPGASCTVLDKDHPCLDGLVWP